MVSATTRKAYSEVDAFLSLLSEDRQEMIPEKLREYFKINKDGTYDKVIDPTREIYAQHLMEDTLAILAFLHLQYCQYQH